MLQSGAVPLQSTGGKSPLAEGRPQQEATWKPVEKFMQPYGARAGSRLAAQASRAISSGVLPLSLGPKHIQPGLRMWALTPSAKHFAGGAGRGGRGVGGLGGAGGEGGEGGEGTKGHIRVQSVSPSRRPVSANDRRVNSQRRARRMFMRAQHIPVTQGPLRVVLGLPIIPVVRSPSFLARKIRAKRSSQKHHVIHRRRVHHAAGLAARDAVGARVTAAIAPSVSTS